MKQRHHRAQQKLVGPLRSQSSFVKLGTELSLHHQFCVLSSARGTEKPVLVPEKPGICHLSFVKGDSRGISGVLASKAQAESPDLLP